MARLIVVRLYIKDELPFLKTPIIRNNIIANEIKISGNIKLKFSINYYKQDLY